MSLFICIVAILTIVSGITAIQQPQWYSCCTNTTNTTTTTSATATFYITIGRNSSCIVSGYFIDTINSNGWSSLHIVPSSAAEGASSVSHTLLYAAAGYLEGYITQTRMFQSQRNNFYANFGNRSSVPTTVMDYVLENLAWTEAQVRMYSDTDEYWRMVGVVYAQMRGLYDGYMAAAPSSQSLTYIDVVMLNMVGDLDDLVPALTIPKQQRDNWMDMSSKTLFSLLRKNSHCSSLIKSTVGHDIVAAHTTWGSYSSMVRTMKYYGFDRVRVHFSSYPGVLSSNDDYYVLQPTNAIVIETTNTIINLSLYEYLTPKSLPTWVRVIVANALGDGGDTWTKLFARYNSGTYNNQWMVLDYKRAESDVLWIISQIPGYTRRQDVTDVLKAQTYWASYNRPYFKDIFAMAGYATMEKKYGSYLFGYEEYFRGMLFKREHANVSTVADMERVMTLNRWQTDPLSHHYPGFAISSRYDLADAPPVPNPSGWFSPSADGGLDCKISNRQWVQSTMRIRAQSGPTHATQIPFQWAGSRWESIPHAGHPPLFNFDFVDFDNTKM